MWGEGIEERLLKWFSVSWGRCAISPSQATNQCSYSKSPKLLQPSGTSEVYSAVFMFLGENIGQEGWAVCFWNQDGELKTRSGCTEACKHFYLSDLNFNLFWSLIKVGWLVVFYTLPDGDSQNSRLRLFVMYLTVRMMTSLPTMYAILSVFHSTDWSVLWSSSPLEFIIKQVQRTRPHYLYLLPVSSCPTHVLWKPWYSPSQSGTAATRPFLRLGGMVG